VAFERKVRSLGVALINSRPEHPETLGKLEPEVREALDSGWAFCNSDGRGATGGPMSISSMTNVAIARRGDDLGVGDRPVLRSIADTSAAAAPKPDTESVGSAALKAIVTYIPTEVITLYVATLAAVRAGSSTSPGQAISNGELATFWTYLILTPVIVWAVYAGKVKTAGKALPASPSKWPWWEMFAATIAYTAWAYALPDSPFSRLSWYNVALGTLVVLVASTALGLLAPIVTRKLNP